MQEIIKALGEVQLFDLILQSNNYIKLCLLVQTLALIALVVYTVKSLFEKEIDENLIIFGLFGVILGIAVLFLGLQRIQADIEFAKAFNFELKPIDIAQIAVPFAYGFIVFAVSLIPQILIKILPKQNFI